MRIIAAFIENNSKIEPVSWLRKVESLLRIEDSNCKDISRFLFSLGSTNRGSSHFNEMGKYLESNCGYSRDLNLWTVLGFEFQYENNRLQKPSPVVPDREPTQPELTEFSDVVLGIALRLLILQNGYDIDLEIDIARRSGVINSLINWLLDLKYDHGIDKMESVMSAKSNAERSQQANDPELNDLLKFLVRGEAE
ncbi:MAG: hypothetical protein IPL83_07475 [Bdellovibrionales bacterium]|nr:hypothetical protein [Bdellovibrionales bacterium]